MALVAKEIGNYFVLFPSFYLAHRQVDASVLIKFELKFY